jgi:hypothetical protein
MCVAYLPEDTTNTAVFWDKVSIDYRNVSKTVTEEFEKNRHFEFRGPHIFKLQFSKSLSWIKS